MVIFATFKGFKNNKNKPKEFRWLNVNNEIGYKIEDNILSNDDLMLASIKLKFGNRYRIVCDNLIDCKIYNIINIKLVNKNPRCDVFRRFKDEFHIISGKYTGRKDEDLNKFKLIPYCLWLAEHSENEATIKNAFLLLEKYKL